MGGFIFGAGRGRISEKRFEQITAVALRHGVYFVFRMRPSDGARYWFSAPDCGEPFNRATADAVFFELRAAGLADNGGIIRDCDSYGEHDCGGQIMMGGNGEDRHLYCDTCCAFAFFGDGADDKDTFPEMPSGIDRAATSRLGSAATTAVPMLNGTDAPGHLGGMVQRPTTFSTMSGGSGSRCVPVGV